MTKLIAVTSDTHGKIEPLVSDLRQRKNLDRLVHLGDYSQDARNLESLLGRPIVRVRGNNDIFDQETEDERILTIAGHRLLLTHGHLFHVHRNRELLVPYAKEQACDVVLYGHTHSYSEENMQGVYLLNPGALNWPRGDGMTSYALLHLEEGGSLWAERIFLS